ncbi:hypothetical protein SUDANB171_03826 [Streptomyces sp. enrichment culture]|uniref:hypothetical protein n=1 Tax=Streptomyces sp. enrichment culture TaxID=1795815 RepID=UPI003F55291F
MTRRRTRTALIAASAATALLLTACGGSDNGDASDDIPGVDETTEEPGGPEDEPEDEDRAGRPDIDLGSDFENIHELGGLNDPELNEVALDVQGFQDAVAEAIVSHENDRPALRYYIAGPALGATMTMLDGIYEQGLSSGGTTRYFNYSVTLLGDGAATFSFCRDFSEVYTIDATTEEIVEEADSDAKPTLYVGRVEQNEDGVWQTVEYDPKHEANECV